MPCDKLTPAIWPKATMEDVAFIARKIENIARVYRGESRFWWHALPRKTEHPNDEPHYITYRIENEMRAAMKMTVDPELDIPVPFKADFTLYIGDG